MYTPEDKIAIEKEINEIITKRSSLTTVKKQYELKISLLNNKVRGIKVTSEDYENICSQQDFCKVEIQKIQIQLDDLSKQNRDKQIIREEIYNFLNKDSNKVNIYPIFEELRALRFKYNQFASDHTRISSTRLMASKFVGELDMLMKNLK